MSSKFNEASHKMGAQNDFGSSSGAPRNINASSNQPSLSPSMSSQNSSFHNPKQTKVSNLTKNLLSNKSSLSYPNQEQPQPHSQTDDQIPMNPPSYHASLSPASNHRYIPTSGAGNEAFSNNINSQKQSTPDSIPNTSSFNQNNHIYHPNRQSFNSQFAASASDSVNYIPSGHHTPNVVSSSYSSNHSYNTPHSFHATGSSSNPFIPQSSSQLAQSSQQAQQSQPGFFSASGSYKPNGMMPHANPTTTISMDSANSSSSNQPVAPSSSFNNINNHQNSSHGSSQLTAQLQQQNQHQQQNQSFAPNSLNQRYSQHQSFSNNAQPSSFNSNYNAFQQEPQYHPPQQSEKQQQQPSMNRLPSVSSTHQYSTSQSNSSSSFPGYSYTNTQHGSRPPSYIPSQPDHYMTYQEFLHGLSIKDNEAAAAAAQATSSGGIGIGAGYNENGDHNGSDSTGNADFVQEEHLNIVDYPVNDLILMLSCLLTKIIEANDKLHPNHFDNTIAIRQRYKEEKKLRKLEKENRQHQKSRGNQGTSGDDAINVDENDRDNDNDNISVDNASTSDIAVDEDDSHDNDIDDEEDEMKNKYLANVLAFHGTNVPGISLHAYLSRVLKYCPVTNEVFLSLLVYFDRIAKKANNLRSSKSKKSSGGSSYQGDAGASLQNNEEDSSESEQLFVMDSYNIHRLIISGITVSSKFFSDIFYKNLRYAKVGGLPLEELNYLELQFLLLLDFKLMISVEDLQNYGDLLLKFWKREQLTNELVNNSSSQQNERTSQSQDHNGDQSASHAPDVSGAASSTATEPASASGQSSSKQQPVSASPQQ